MSMPNPFVPAGSLIAERQRRQRGQFKIGVYAVLAAHMTLVLGLLFEGCKSDDAGVPAPTPGHVDMAPSQSHAEVVPVPPPVASAVAQPSGAAARPGVNSNVAAALSAPTASTEGTGANLGLFCVVKSGDTIGQIARAHGTTVEAIKAANGLKGNRLVVGRSLRLPAGSRMVIASAAQH